MYDILIIGAGPAGITASLYTQRANLKTCVLYKETSSLEKAKKIENYYGFENGITGKELFDTGIKQAKNLGVEIYVDEVIKIEKEEKGFKITCLQGEYYSKIVILATGNKKNTLHIQGLDKFEGKGVSYCAICDGFFYRNKNVAVIGSGNYAISETMDLLGVAKSITILTNGKEMPEYRAESVTIDKRPIKKVDGEEKIEDVEFEDNSKLKIDGIFIAEGVAGTMDFARKLGAITEKDRIIVNENMETNIEGLYACGDCTGGLFQISKAVYEGTKAALQAISYIKLNKGGE